MTSKNPLLSPFTQTHKAIPFASIKTEHYLPALIEAITAAKKLFENIKKQPVEQATFESVLMALEEASEGVDIVGEVYFNLLSAEADEPMHALAAEMSPMLAAFSNDILLDTQLFRLIEKVNSDKAKLNPEQARYVDKSYKGFVRNGARLSAEHKKELRLIDEELSKLGPTFSENLQKATYAYELIISDKADLAGLPEAAIEAAAMAAEAKGKKNAWLFNLEAPSFVPFVTFSENRKLREAMYKAYTSRSYGGPYDNTDLVKKIATLRHKRACLLGFSSHADYVLEERMAESTVKVKNFLDRLLKIAKPAADKDIEKLKEFMKSEGATFELMPWDYGFYYEKYKKKKLNFDAEALRPYFQLEKVVDGIFVHAKKLYNLEFKALTGVEVYHPDVKVFEVRDTKKGIFVGLFYTDFFPRPTKKGGAWMTPLREQGYFGGELMRPHVSIVCNFTKPTPTKPSLLSLDEVKTLFHEFGHALHGLLSQVHYRALAGTNVYWDFVELPSQMMENWVAEKESLDLFAAHFETGEKIPAEMALKIKKAESFNAAYTTLRQLSFAFLDMAWHSQDPSGVNDIDAFEKKATESTRVLARVENSNISVAFAHVFAGGYSAGYYSYKWAEVLDADAFEYFQEKGIFSAEVAQKFQEHILSRGGSEHPMELYIKFRGREPDPDALLRRDGLL